MTASTVPAARSGNSPQESATRLPSTTRSWTITDTLLYAVGVGAGSDDPTSELCFTTENSAGVELRTVPTFGIALSTGGSEIFAAIGARDADVLLLSEHIELAAPVPVEGTVRTTRHVASETPHRRGRVVRIEATARLEGADAVLYRTTSETLVRDPSLAGRTAGGRPRPFTAAPPTPWGDPATRSVQFTIPPNQALVYRLAAGRNPLHSDPAVAAAAGFDRPILHGRCTLGFAARLLVRHACGGDPAGLTALGARMTAPVWPGDTLVLEAWSTDHGGHFRVRRPTDDQVVLDEGTYRCRPTE